MSPVKQVRHCAFEHAGPPDAVRVATATLPRAFALVTAFALALVAALAFGAANANADAGKILVFTGTAGSPNSATDDAVDAIEALGDENDFEVDVTSSASAINAGNLAQYRAVVFVHSSGDVLDSAQEQALVDYVDNGGGFVAIGDAAGLEPGNSAFDRLLGITGNPRTSGSDGPSAQDVEFLDRVHPATRDLPALFEGHEDAWYQWTNNPTGSVHTVARVRFGTVPTGESITNDAVRTNPNPQTNRPVSWCRDLEDGRSFYVGFGRTEDAWGADEIQAHVLGAIQWAAGMVRGNCKATITSNYQATRLNPNNPVNCPSGAGNCLNVPDATRYVGESHGMAIADDGRVFYIGRAICGQGMTQQANWDAPNPALGCGTLHVWDPSVPGSNNQNGDKITQIARFQVFGAKGGGAETGATSKDEQGILGIALDPDFTKGRPYIYLQWFPYFEDEHGPGFDRQSFMAERRVSRFTYDEETKSIVPGSEKVILHWLTQVYSCCHVGGAMAFDSEGNLHIATGDNIGNSPNSNNSGYTNAHENYTVPTNGQVGVPGGVISYADARQTSGSTFALEGKLLRIKPKANPGPTPKLAISSPGQEPGPVEDVYPSIEGFEFGGNGDYGEGTTYDIPGEDAPNGPNLFTGEEGNGNQARPEIFAMGVRNLFTLNIDPKTDAISASWVGPDQGTVSPTWGPAKTENAVIMTEAGNYGWPYCTGNRQHYRAKLPSTSGGGQPAPFGHPGTVGGGEDGQTGGFWDCLNPNGIVNDSPFNEGLPVVPPAKPVNIWYGAAGGCYDYARNANGVPIYTNNNNAQPPASYRRCPWAHGGGQAVIAGPIYRYDAAKGPERWPEYWDGRWFIGDFSSATNIRHALLMDEETWGEGTPPIAVDSLSGIFGNSMPANSLMDLEFGPDGALYAHRYSGGFFSINNANNGVWRYSYIGGPDTPGPDPEFELGDEPGEVEFSIGKSGGVAYEWDFGDGDTSDEPNPTHTFAASGKHEVTLTVIYADGEEASKTIEVEVTGANAPQNVEPPVLTGTGKAGTMLTCEPGTWSASGTNSFSWTVDGEPVEVGTEPGQTGSTNPKRFRASAEFAGKEVRCQVVKTNAQWGASEPAESNGVVVQAQVNVPQNVTPPSVTGSGKVGTMLTCDPGEWTLSGSYTYTWLLDGDPVPVGTGPGETGSTNPIRYRAKADEVGKSVVCRVTRTNGNGTSAPADSNAVVINTGS